jgi:hypothetical protein
MMRKLILIFAAVTAICAMAATAEQLREETFDHLQAVETKQRNLKTKVYSGTWDQVLAVRVADVNEVVVEISRARVKAAELMAVSETAETVREAIQEAIRDKTRQQEHTLQRGNGEFLQAIEEYLADPNNIPEPNDLEEIARVEDFRSVCLWIVELRGGI